MTEERVSTCIISQLNGFQEPCSHAGTNVKFVVSCQALNEKNQRVFIMRRRKRASSQLNWVSRIGKTCYPLFISTSRHGTSPIGYEDDQLVDFIYICPTFRVDIQSSWSREARSARETFHPNPQPTPIEVVHARATPSSSDLRIDVGMLASLRFKHPFTQGCRHLAWNILSSYSPRSWRSQRW